MAAGYRTVPAPGRARALSNVHAAPGHGTAAWRVAANRTGTSRTERTGTNHPPEEAVAAIRSAAAAAAGMTARTMVVVVAMRIVVVAEAEVGERRVETVATVVRSGVSRGVVRRRRW